MQLKYFLFKGPEGIVVFKLQTHCLLTLMLANPTILPMTKV
jgi:hypothetical protein